MFMCFQKIYFAFVIKMGRLLGKTLWKFYTYRVIAVRKVAYCER